MNAKEVSSPIIGPNGIIYSHDEYELLMKRDSTLAPIERAFEQAFAIVTANQLKKVSGMIGALSAFGSREVANNVEAILAPIQEQEMANAVFKLYMEAVDAAADEFDARYDISSKPVKKAVDIVINALDEPDWNTIREEQKAYLRDKATQFSKLVTGTNKSLARQALLDGITAGESEADLGKRILGIVNIRGHQARMIARTEMSQTFNSTHQALGMKGMEYGIFTNKRWITAFDKRVRDSHRIHSQDVEVNLPFTLADGAQVMHPGDGSLGAGLGDIINCRCTIQFLVSDEIKQRQLMIDGDPDAATYESVAAPPKPKGDKAAQLQARLEHANKELDKLDKKLQAALGKANIAEAKAIQEKMDKFIVYKQNALKAMQKIGVQPAQTAVAAPKPIDPKVIQLHTRIAHADVEIAKLKAKLDSFSWEDSATQKKMDYATYKAKRMKMYTQIEDYKKYRQNAVDALWNKHGVEVKGYSPTGGGSAPKLSELDALKAEMKVMHDEIYQLELEDAKGKLSPPGQEDLESLYDKYQELLDKKVALETAQKAPAPMPASKPPVSKPFVPADDPDIDMTAFAPKPVDPPNPKLAVYKERIDKANIEIPKIEKALADAKAKYKVASIQKLEQKLDKWQVYKANAIKGLEKLGGKAATPGFDDAIIAAKLPPKASISYPTQRVAYTKEKITELSETVGKSARARADALAEMISKEVDPQQRSKLMALYDEAVEERDAAAKAYKKVTGSLTDPVNEIKWPASSSEVTAMGQKADKTIDKIMDKMNLLPADAHQLRMELMSELIEQRLIKLNAPKQAQAIAAEEAKQAAAKAAAEAKIAAEKAAANALKRQQEVDAAQEFLSADDAYAMAWKQWKVAESKQMGDDVVKALGETVEHLKAKRLTAASKYKDTMRGLGHKGVKLPNRKEWTFGDDLRWKPGKVSGKGVINTDVVTDMAEFQKKLDALVPDLDKLRSSSSTTVVNETQRLRLAVMTQKEQDAINDMLSSWTGSSWSTTALKLHHGLVELGNRDERSTWEAVIKIMKLKNKHGGMSWKDDLDRAIRYYQSNKAIYDSALAKQYMLTQKVLGLMYPDGKVKLYRGIKANELAKDAQTYRYTHAPGASWSLSKSKARDFAQGGGAIFEEWVNIEEVFASFYDAFEFPHNYWSEKEFIRIGMGEQAYTVAGLAPNGIRELVPSIVKSAFELIAEIETSFEFEEFMHGR